MANFGTQSGGDIDASIASAYLENFEDLNKRGIDREVISTVAGMVYFGEYSRAVAYSICF